MTSWESNLKSIFQAKMHCWVGGQGGQKKTESKKNNHDEPFFKIIYQKLMKFINSQFLKTHILKHHHATSKHIALASQAFG